MINKWHISEKKICDRNGLCLFSWHLLLAAGVSCFIHIRIPSVGILRILHRSGPFRFGLVSLRGGSILLIATGKDKLGVVVMLQFLL